MAFCHILYYTFQTSQGEKKELPVLWDWIVIISIEMVRYLDARNVVLRPASGNISLPVGSVSLVSLNSCSTKGNSFNKSLEYGTRYILKMFLLAIVDPIPELTEKKEKKREREQREGIQCVSTTDLLLDHF